MAVIVRTVAAAGLLSVVAGVAAAQDVIRLGSGPPTASVISTRPEKEYFSQLINTEVVTNVSQPTLTVYAPAPSTANGTAVIICPGGGFYILGIKHEGVDVAKWLNARGITAFVLKYRLVPTGEDGVADLLGVLGDPPDLRKLDGKIALVVPLAVADGLAAVGYVRSHAAEFGIAPDRVGIMGFSAGGTVAAAVAFQYRARTRPDFVAPIYPYMGVVKEVPVPNDAPPLFVAAAADDQLRLAPDSTRLFERWLAAGKSAELHIYAKGGHGFGLREQKLPTDQWIERFADWLGVQGLLKSHP
jgi:acetyl esterase/lipase